MDIFTGLISWSAIILGGGFLIIGGIGLLRMPDFFTRLHAASIVDTLGTMLILFALMVHSGWSLVTIKLILILLFILLTSPAAAHALAKASIHGGLKPLLDE